MAQDNSPIQVVEFKARATANKADLKGLNDAHDLLVKLKNDLDAINAAFSGASIKSFKYTADELKKILQQNPLTQSKKALSGKDVMAALGVPSEEMFKREMVKARAQQALVRSQLQQQGIVVSNLEEKMARARSAARKKSLDQELKDARRHEEKLRREFNEKNYFDPRGNFTSAGQAAAFSKKYYDDLNKKQGLLQQALFSRGAGAASPSGASSPPPAPATRGPGKKTSGTAGGVEETEDAGKKFKVTLAQINKELKDTVAGVNGKGLRPEKYDALQKSAAAIRLAAGAKGLDPESVPVLNALAKASDLEAKAQSLRQGQLDQSTKLRQQMQAAKARQDKAEEQRLKQELRESERQEKAMRQSDERRWKAQNKMLAAGQKAEADIAKTRQQTTEHDARQTAFELRRFGAKRAEQELIARGAKLKEYTYDSSTGTKYKTGARYYLDQAGMRHTFDIDYSKRNGGSVKEKVQAMPELPPAKKTRWQSAVEGLSAPNMAANILKVSEWALAVGVLYKGLELVEYSMHRLIETGMETAHLSLVYRGVGGSVQQLTSDIIGLAAAQGRETGEAMESATEWARLGGDRKTINDEVRVSAVAATISGLKMTETTRQLSALMHIYGLESADLDGVLGGLVNTTLKYNVTLEDLFGGLDRSAGAARLAGVSLAELQGMIGTVVGRTGQSGIIVGNTIKSLLVQFTNPEIQRQLKGFGIDTLNDRHQQKPGGQILGEIWEKWDTMGADSQKDLTRITVGRLGAARGVALFEGYTESMKLAIDAQLNLNKAQEANVRILDTMKAQMAGVKANYDKLLVNSGASTWWTQQIRTVKNVMGNWAGDTLPDAFSGSVLEKKSSELQTALNPENNFNPQSVQEAQDELARREVARAKRLGLTSAKGFQTSPYSRKIGMDMTIQRSGFDRQTWDNIWDEWDPIANSEKDFKAQMLKLNGEAQANALRANLFSHVSGRLRQGGSLRPDEMQDIVDSMGDQKQGLKFKAAFAAGDTNAMLGISDFERDNSIKVHEAKLKESNDKHHDMVVAAHAEMDKQQAIMDANPKGSEAHTKAEAAKKAQSESLDALTAEHRKYNAVLQDEKAALESAIPKSREYLGFIAASDDALERISGLHHQVQAPTQVMALEQDAATARAQIASIQQRKILAKNYPFLNETEREAVNLDLNAKEKNAYALLDKSTNRDVRNKAELYDAGERGIRGAGYLGLANDYGMNQGDRLLRQRAALQADLPATKRQADAAGSEVERNELNNKLLAEQRALHENSLAILERRAGVERDINQLYFDRAKEMRRNVLGGGPSELLRTLAAFRTAFDAKGNLNNISIGQLLSYAPEFRKAVTGAQAFGVAQGKKLPGVFLDPEMMGLQTERNQLNQPLPPVPAGGWEQAVKEIGGVVDTLSLGLKTFNTAMDFVTNFGDKLHEAATAVENFINSLNLRMTGVPAGAAPAVPQSGGLGGASGFTRPGVRTF